MARVHAKLNALISREGLQQRLHISGQAAKLQGVALRRIFRPLRIDCRPDVLHELSKFGYASVLVRDLLGFCGAQHMLADRKLINSTLPHFASAYQGAHLDTGSSSAKGGPATSFPELNNFFRNLQKRTNEAERKLIETQRDAAADAILQMRSFEFHLQCVQFVIDRTSHAGQRATSAETERIVSRALSVLNRNIAKLD